MPSSGVQTCADRKSTRLNSSHGSISYAVFCLKKKQIKTRGTSSLENNSLLTPAQDDTLHDRSSLSRVRLDLDPRPPILSSSLFFFFFNDTATTEIYTLSLHDALPIFLPVVEVPCQEEDHGQLGDF